MVQVKTNAISPVEYYYLSNLISGSGSEMLKLTLQDLCLRQVLKISKRSIIVDLRYGKARPRIFFCRGRQYHNYTRESYAEEFFLKLFNNTEELRFFAIRKYVQNELDKSSFDRLVYKDLKKKNFCNLKIFPTSQAIKLRKRINQKVTFLNNNLDTLIKNDSSGLAQKIEDLGSHILLLDEENLKKLADNSELLQKVAFLELSQNQFSSNLFTSIGIFSTMDSGGFADFSGFDGFGGGDFGGGGAMGDW